MRNRLSRCLLAGLLVSAVAIAAVSCREVNGTVYSGFANVSSEGWDPRARFGFEPLAEDSLLGGAPLDVEVCVRYSARRIIPPFRMGILVEDENGELKADTVVMNLFDEYGRPTGSGRLGVYTVRIPVLNGVMPKPGFSIELANLSPADSTRGILNAGIVMTEP